MIRGEIRHYNNGLDTDFEDFIRLVGYANLTFQRIQKGVASNEMQFKDEVKFNYTNNLRDYSSHLHNKLEGMKTDILHEVINQTSRFEKLVYISIKVAELKRTIGNLCESEKGWTHSKFSFSNISKGEGSEVIMNEADIQEYYNCMKQYSDEAFEYLKIIKQSVEESSNDDFPVLKPLPPDPNEATQVKPLAFFEYFFIARGFTKFHKNFYPTEDEEYYNISSINKEKEVIVYEDYHPETYETLTYRVEFKEELLKKLHSEFIKTKKHIDAHIDTLSSEPDINLYLKLLLYRLRFIYNGLQKYNEAVNYESCSKVLKGLVKFVFDKYEPFVKEYVDVEFFKQIITPSIELQDNLVLTTVSHKLLPHKEVIYSFKWTSYGPERTTKLHMFLRDKGFIPDDVELIHFSKAFNGELIEHPLNIKWLKKVKGKLSKPLILYLFDQLKEKKLIEDVSPDQEIYKKVQRIFTDHNGKPLKYFNVSSAQIKKRKIDYTEQEREIMSILANLQ